MWVYEEIVEGQKLTEIITPNTSTSSTYQASPFPTTWWLFLTLSKLPPTRTSLFLSFLTNSLRGRANHWLVSLRQEPKGSRSSKGLPSSQPEESNSCQTSFPTCSRTSVCQCRS